MEFSQLGLRPALLRRCESLGYTEPTAIQERAIPVVLSGADLIGCAETGTGKTAAFLLPTIQRMTETPRPGVRVLVLAPTRELVSQIEDHYKQLAPKGSARCAAVIGGASMSRQMDALRRGAGVVVATPGRLLDHVERRTVDLSQVEVLVLDEADRMLDMGFLPAIRRVLAELPSKRQTLLFSATMSSVIEELARSTMKDPKLIEVNVRGRAAVLVEQTAYPVAAESKTALLLDLLERERDNFDRVLVFTRTRRGAERLSHILLAREHKVNRIHADRTQPQREAALRGFKDGQTRVLVATDIAARGIDVDSISHVINYDVPAAPEDYVHRIGRTGRAGKLGRAITLVTPVDELSMRAIERLTGQSVERVVLPLFGGAQAGVRTTQVKTFARPMRGSGAGGRRSFRPRRGAGR
ncbi:MAG: ATP-dependent helicase RhlE [Acidobacteriota bacterium]|jgi:ATP-dependent RNA helicase RhlE|nr:ATP-dependent helicase RhlE [Acidobacteriota bacterium]MDT7779602.1 ATP-dependent helicase RhlE [Acidobacteriota bacterium]